MEKNYKQLSLVQRYQIEALPKVGLKQKLIAKQTGVHPSTVGRELKRNTALRGRTSVEYVTSNAQRKTDLRYQQKLKQVLFTVDMKSHAIKKLKVEKWSFESISVKGKESGECPISREWLYHWIWECKHGNKRKDRDYKSCTGTSNIGEEGVKEVILKMDEAL